MNDDDVVLEAYQGNWVLITNDKDFGEKIYREQRPHKGVVFFRLRNERTANKIGCLQQLLDGYAHQLAHHFVVVTESQVRFAHL